MVFVHEFVSFCKKIEQTYNNTAYHCRNGCARQTNQPEGVGGGWVWHRGTVASLYLSGRCPKFQRDQNVTVMARRPVYDLRELAGKVSRLMFPFVSGQEHVT